MHGQEVDERENVEGTRDPREEVDREADDEGGQEEPPVLGSARPAVEFGVALENDQLPGFDQNHCNVPLLSVVSTTT